MQKMSVQNMKILTKVCAGNGISRFVYMFILILVE